MTARTPTYLKGRYEQGDIPQGTDYEDVFDSYVNVAVSAEQSIDSNLRTTKEFISNTVSANVINTSALNVNVLTVSGTISSLTVTTFNSTTFNSNSVSAQTVAASAATFTTVTADSINVSGNVVLGAFDVSALSTTQASAVLINGTLNFVIFADGNNTAVRLPPSTRGKIQRVINAASTTIKIFPAVSARFLVTAFNASLNLAADKTADITHKGDDRYGMQVG